MAFLSESKTSSIRATCAPRWEQTAFADFVPNYDASVVKKLRHAGALIMGKCVTTVLIFLDPGPTRNAWNTKHTPGGSSSGSAAAVAAQMCPVSIGSQTVVRSAARRRITVSSH
jgi:amidase